MKQNEQNSLVVMDEPMIIEPYAFAISKGSDRLIEEFNSHLNAMLEDGTVEKIFKESIADTARVLGRMFDGIEYRGFGQSIVEELAQYAGVPVWNGLTNEFHPTQILADFLTIQEHFGHLKGIKLVYMGGARYNTGNSLMVGCAKVGMHFVACAPKQYFPNQELGKTCQQIAEQTEATLEFLENPEEAV